MPFGLKRRLWYAAEAILIALGIVPLFMMFYPLALLAAPAPFLAAYAAYRPGWWAAGPREPRRYARQYVHLAACVSGAGLLLFALFLSGILRRMQ
jgi:hypothetical protein